MFIGFVWKPIEDFHVASQMPAACKQQRPLKIQNMALDTLALIEPLCSEFQNKIKTGAHMTKV